MNKNIVRKNILTLRSNIEEGTRTIWNEEIFKFLINENAYKVSTRIFIYVSYKSEVETKNIIEYALKDNKQVYVPKTDVINKTMVAVRISSLDELVVDKYGILEPKVVDKCKIAKELELIIMPGVAFDREGSRIGYGGGYYDKYLSNINYKVTKIALAYQLQVMEKLNKENHDIDVDYIITNKEIIRVK